MTIKETGGPAFPCDNIVERNEKGQLVGVEKSSAGISVRDYFAAKAMQMMWDAYDKGYCGLNNQDAPNVKVISEGAYQMADAMLEARKS